MRFKVLSLFAVLFTAAAVASCSEDIAAGQACPLLCPQETPPLKDTIIDAVTFDTSIVGFPPLGFESTLLLGRRGDSLDARIVTRYDTLPTKYSAAGQDSSITRIVTAFVRGRRLRSDSTAKLQDSATVEAYDVTDAANDTATASLLGEFTAANKMGSVRLAKGDNPDTLKVPLDTVRILSRITTGHRIRIALRMVTSGSAQLRFISQDDGEGFSLVLRPSPDTSVASLVVTPHSDSLPGLPVLSSALADFPLIALSPPMSSPSLLRVGGYPARRVLLRFKLPAHIVDSSAVIRATLFVTQKPVAGPDAGQTVYLRPAPIIASPRVTDLHLFLEFAAAQSVFPIDSVALVPKDSGKREIDIVTIVRSWRGQDTTRTPRAIALILQPEGVQPTTVDFFSTEAIVGVRPQLRVTYATKPSSGRP